MSKKIKILVFLCVIIPSLLWSQDDKLAETYFKNGDYAKAEILYKDLVSQRPNVLTYLDYYIQTLQLQDKYDAAEQFINGFINNDNKRLKDHHKAFAEVLLGQTFNIKQDSINAKIHFDKAFNILKEVPSQSYQIAKKFHDIQALEYARDSYEFIMATNTGANYHFQLAAVYGELGDTEKMFDTLFGYLTNNPQRISSVKNYLTRYLSNDNRDANNTLLRQILVKRIQKEPVSEWYDLLAWLFTLQKDYNKALLQKKSAFLQGFDDLEGVKSIGQIAFDEKEYEVVKNAFEFVKTHANSTDELIQADYYILESLKHIETDLDKIQNRYQAFFLEFPPSPLNVQIQVSYADFLAFYLNNTDESINVLDRALKLSKNNFDEAAIKLQLGNILVFDGQYNRALILFTQIQNRLPNHPMGQMARFKVAQTSYFKGDFDWANTQLKVLKSATSKLIANDAMNLSILIETNKMNDSTDVAIKEFAAADLLSYQNKTQEAISAFNEIAKNYPGHFILDDVLFKQAQLFEKTQQYNQAIEIYEKLLMYNQDDIYNDDAIYHIARLYDEQLYDPDKAKNYYEKIVLEYPSSIYLIKSRKRFRELRGDEMLP